MLTEERQAVTAQTAAPARITRAEPVETGPALTQRGLRAFLRNFLKALRARRKQVIFQREIRTGQDWRDEAQARNPWWGNGF